MKRKILYILLFFPWCFSYAQVDTAWDVLFFEGLENQFSNSESEETDQAEIMEQIQQYQEKKINLNDLDAEVAYVILQFTDYQYYQLQLYLEKYGELVTLYELAAVEGFSKKDVERIQDRVEVLPLRKKKKNVAQFFQQARQSLLLRYGQVLEKQAGYVSDEAKGYLGNPLHLTWKYSFQSGEHFAMAIAGEKDAGEQFFKGTQKQGFDHYSFFVNIKNKGVLKNLVIGNYRLHFGQGLVYGASVMGSKGSGASQIRQFPTLLRATAPMNESDCVTGLAAVIGNSRYKATLFYGHRFFDGKIQTDSDSNRCYEGALMVDGYHRTITECEQKNQLMSRIYGAHFEMRTRVFSMGASVSETDFLCAVMPSPELYKQFDFSGRHLLNLGADYKWILHKTILFGEVAYSGTRAGAVIQGALFEWDPRCKIALLFRYYDKKYVALQSGAFGANRSAHNEMGLYMAADFITGRNTSLYVNADYYYFPWPRFRVEAPAAGFDCAVKFQFSLSKWLIGNLKYQYKNKSQNFKEIESYYSLAFQKEHLVRLVFHTEPLHWLKLQTEIDYLVHIADDYSYSKGFLWFHDIEAVIEKWNLGAKMRVAIFDTDSYNERLGAFEQDLLYTFTINNYYGRGLRYYLMLHYQYRFVKFQIRFSQTYWDGKTEIGSGNTMIQGNTKSELKTQIIFNF